jgi:rare lipoprotein A
LCARGCGPLLILAIALLAGGCATKPTSEQRRALDPDSVPDAAPQVEPRSKYGNPPTYEVFGKRYETLTESRGFVDRGIASWYGEDFHGKRTSNGETYDMFGMTAAHKELPLPTYARVTNLENGRSIVVKINDRGPFHSNRIIDLSWVAAAKLRLAAKGTGLVEVRAIDPVDPTALPPPDFAGPTRVAAEAPVPAPRVAPPATPIGTPPPATAAAKAAQAASTALQARSSPSAPAAGALPPPRGPVMFIQVGAFASRENADRIRARVASDLKRPVRVDSGQANGRELHRVRVGPVGSVDEADLLVARLEGIGLTNPRVVVD